MVQFYTMKMSDCREVNINKSYFLLYKELSKVNVLFNLSTPFIQSNKPNSQFKFEKLFNFRIIFNYINKIKYSFFMFITTYIWTPFYVQIQYTIIV
jgi:hypothetical protein